MRTVVVYTRPECHLCEQAIERIAAMHGREGLEFELHEIDIESDQMLMRRMLEKIPVVEVDGLVVSELILDEGALQARLDTVPMADGRGDDRGDANR